MAKLFCVFKALNRPYTFMALLQIDCASDIVSLDWYALKHHASMH
jgi:hypothetical protein